MRIKRRTSFFGGVFLFLCLGLLTNCGEEESSGGGGGGGTTSRTLVLGQSSATASSANGGGTASDSVMNAPRGLWSDGTKLYVVDSGNSRVLIWNTIPSTTGTAADVVVGQANMTSSGINGGSGAGNASASTLYSPQGVWSNGTKLIIADAQNHRVLIWNTVPTANGAAADVVVGQNDFTSEDQNQGGAVSASTLYFPSGVFSDGTRLFIADSFNNRVLIFNTIPTTDGATADVVIGQPATTTNGSNQGGLSAATMDLPLDVFSNGTKVYVADAANHRVLVWNTMPGSTGASADFVLGQANFVSNSANGGGSASASTLSAPSGVYSDGTRLFVADDSNNRVLQWSTLPTTTAAAADVVYGQSNFTGTSANGGGTTSQTSLSAPEALFSDGTNLYVPDAGNHRVAINPLS